MSDALKLRGITKAYNLGMPTEIPVLKGVDFTLTSGEVVALVAPSGAGKSTLLHVAGLLDTPDEGLVEIGGQPVGNGDRARTRLRRQDVGFVYQFHHLLGEFTALENVCIPAFIANKNKQETEKEAKRLLEYLGLSNRIDHKPNALSGGEQQRVAVARALINKPDVIFADEPSGNLDTLSAENLHQLFFQLRDEFGQTFVIVTHNEELANMADRKLIMIDGQISNP